MVNAILHVSPKSELGEANPSSSIGAVHEDSACCIEQDELDRQRLDKSNLTWAQPAQVLELKPFLGGLVDGSHIPRLLRNGLMTNGTSQGISHRWNLLDLQRSRATQTKSLLEKHPVRPGSGIRMSCLKPKAK